MSPQTPRNRINKQYVIKSIIIHSPHYFVIAFLHLCKLMFCVCFDWPTPFIQGPTVTIVHGHWTVLQTPTSSFSLYSHFEIHLIKLITTHFQYFITEKTFCYKIFRRSSIIYSYQIKHTDSFCY